MTQNYPRQMNPLPQGMPIIPPRLQQQQQQEVIEKHRRLQQHNQQMQQTQGSFRIQGNHSRSVSNGNPRYRQAENEPSSNSYNYNNGNNNDSNGFSQYNGGGRLRSESNPSHSSNSSSENYYESLWATSHNRANSSGSSASGYSARTGLANRSNTTGSSFQERMRERDREKQQREREERETAARAFREDLSMDSSLNQPPVTTSPPTSNKKAAIWNKLRAAKDVINATITGEERWPDSDDSDYEGESHVSRVLRELLDKKEADNVAAKIVELEMMDKVSAIPPPIPKRSASNRNRNIRDAFKRENSNSGSSNSSHGDVYEQSLRSRGENGHQASRSEDIMTNGGALTTNGVSAVRMNRFRTSSDASLSEALGRLEGKRNQDALVAQVSHLGSTRARSPHRGNRAYKDNIDTVPPPPLPTPKSSYRQQHQHQQQQQPSLSPPSSSSSRRLNNLGVYGQRKQQDEHEATSSYNKKINASALQNSGALDYEVAGPTVGGAPSPYSHAKIESAKERLVVSMKNKVNGNTDIYTVANPSLVDTGASRLASYETLKGMVVEKEEHLQQLKQELDEERLKEEEYLKNLEGTHLQHQLELQRQLVCLKLEHAEKLKHDHDQKQPRSVELEGPNRQVLHGEHLGAKQHLQQVKQQQKQKQLEHERQLQ
ncbi:hypothetical protein BGX21_009059 [Mortierella sp. AD011]|nr:hypothetical protein BGX21_009059 [Mortierella sp. AD011]